MDMHVAGLFTYYVVLFNIGLAKYKPTRNLWRKENLNTYLILRRLHWSFSRDLV